MWLLLRFNFVILYVLFNCKNCLVIGFSKFCSDVALCKKHKLIYVWDYACFFDRLSGTRFMTLKFHLHGSIFVGGISTSICGSLYISDRSGCRSWCWSSCRSCSTFSWLWEEHQYVALCLVLVIEWINFCFVFNYAKEHKC